jgi:hypothetical protein
VVNRFFTNLLYQGLTTNRGVHTMMIIAAMLASAQVMPWLDRDALEAQAKVEKIRRAPAVARPRPTAFSARDALAKDIEAISTVCGAAARSPDPAAFLGNIGDAFAMSRGEVSALRERCALYLAGRRDARLARLPR